MQISGTFGERAWGPIYEENLMVGPYMIEKTTDERMRLFARKGALTNILAEIKKFEERLKNAEEHESLEEVGIVRLEINKFIEYLLGMLKILEHAEKFKHIRDRRKLDNARTQ